MVFVNQDQDDELLGGHLVAIRSAWFIAGGSDIKLWETETGNNCGGNGISLC